MDTASLAPSDVSLSRRITGYIEKHYQDADLSVHKLAEIFQLNPSYMGMLFKKVNHQSILQYLIRVRMEAEVRLIAEGQYRITDIAKMVGYPDVFYFSKRLKKRMGFRRRNLLGGRKRNKNTEMLLSPLCYLPPLTVRIKSGKLSCRYLH